MNIHGFIWKLNILWKGGFVMDQKNQEEDKKERIFKIIVMILIIIIIILLLLMGCSCTSKLIGKIGDIFSNEGNYTIDGNTDNEIIVNQDLKFYLDEFTMYLSDKDGKLSYYYQNIHPGEFTCHTSDSEIATCYVKDNYVIVFPKKTGDVEIYLDTFVNGKTYRAKSLVHVLDSNRSIILSSNSGSVLKGNTKNINQPLTEGTVFQRQTLMLHLCI